METTTRLLHMFIPENKMQQKVIYSLGLTVALQSDFLINMNWSTYTLSPSKKKSTLHYMDIYLSSLNFMQCK